MRLFQVSHFPHISLAVFFFFLPTCVCVCVCVTTALCYFCGRKSRFVFCVFSFPVSFSFVCRLAVFLFFSLSCVFLSFLLLFAFSGKRRAEEKKKKKKEGGGGEVKRGEAAAGLEKERHTAIRTLRDGNARVATGVCAPP